MLLKIDIEVNNCILTLNMVCVKRRLSICFRLMEEEIVTKNHIILYSILLSSILSYKLYFFHFEKQSFAKVLNVICNCFENTFLQELSCENKNLKSSISAKRYA